MSTINDNILTGISIFVQIIIFVVEIVLWLYLQ